MMKLKLVQVHAMGSPQAMSYQARGLCVLLIEDDDADAYLATRVLTKIPRVYEVVRAKSGQDAIDMLTSGQVQPDIAFVDLKMPTMDGLEFMASCMDKGLANVPMVVLTSSSDWKDTLRSRVQGAYQVITKPDDPSDLRRLLQEAIDAFLPLPAAVKGSPSWTIAERMSSASSHHEPVVAKHEAPTAAIPAFGRRTLRPRG